MTSVMAARAQTCTGSSWRSLVRRMTLLYCSMAFG